jgi:chromosome partitioning protein
MLKIITVTGYKGGVGKSTTAIHLAAYFSTLGKTVLVDGDLNRTAVTWAARGELPFMVGDERQMGKIIQGAEFAIIDTPARPSSDDLKELAKGCDLMILPTIPDVVSVDPMLTIARDLEGLGAKYRALITLVPPLPSRNGEMMREELDRAKIPVFRAMIRRTVLFGNAALEGKLISQLGDARAYQAWSDYESIGKEIEGLI